MDVVEQLLLLFLQKDRILAISMIMKNSTFKRSTPVASKFNELITFVMSFAGQLGKEDL